MLFCVKDENSISLLASGRRPLGSEGDHEMGARSLRLPISIHRHIKEIAQKEGVSINQFISSAVSEKISAIMTEDYLNSRADRAKNPT